MTKTSVSFAEILKGFELANGYEVTSIILVLFVSLGIVPTYFMFMWINKLLNSKNVNDNRSEDHRSEPAAGVKC
ncbi:hypothetical protein D3C77_768150 [compost metagenome]